MIKKLTLYIVLILTTFCMAQTSRDTTIYLPNPLPPVEIQQDTTIVLVDSVYNECEDSIYVYYDTLYVHYEYMPRGTTYTYNYTYVPGDTTCDPIMEYGGTIIIDDSSGNNVNFPPDEPTPVYPINGSSNHLRNLSLSWIGSDPDGDPLTYDIYFGTAPNTLSLVGQGISVTNFSLNGLQYNTTYFWRVFADDGQEFTGSNVWSFTTVAQPSSGPNFYIDKDAPSGGNGLSWVTAWNKFSDISMSSLPKGAIIYISGGTVSKTYNESLNITATNGEAGNPITFTKGIDPGHNGEVILSGGSYGFQCRGSSYDYITVSNLTLTGHTSNSFRFDDNEGCVIDNITVKNGTVIGAHLRNCDNLTLSHFKYTSVLNTNSQSDGITLAQGSGSYIIEYCDVNQLNSGTSHNDCFQAFADQGTKRDMIIRYNHFHMNTNDATNTQGLFIEDANGEIYIYENLITSGSKNSKHMNFKTINSGANMHVFNNTIVAGNDIGNNSIIRFNIESGDPNIDFRNNIVTCTYNGSYSLMNLDGGLSNFISDYNIFYSPNYSNAWDGRSWNSWNYDSHGFNVNPSLDNNYRPDSASDPSVDAGTSVDKNSNPLSNLYSVDYFGVSIPQNNVWDIGASEYLKEQ